MGEEPTTKPKVKHAVETGEEWRDRLDSARQLLKQTIASRAAGSDDPALSACRNDIDVLHGRLSTIIGDVDALRIYSPIEGTITTVYREDGQAVRAGESVALITSSRSEQIVSYIRQDQGFKPTAGKTPVEVHPREPGVHSSYGIVSYVGPRIESIPKHLLRDPKVQEFGTPVWITPNDKTMRITPGQIVGLRFILSD